VVGGGERVVDRQRDDELLLEDEARGEVLAQRVGVDRRERGVQLVGAQPLQQLVLGALDHVDRDARVARVEVGDDVGEVVQARRVHAAELELAAQQAAQLLELVLQALDLVQHAMGVVEDQPALGGQLDRPRRPREDLDPELGLEPADLLGDRRLGEVELLPRLRERAVAGHGGDGAQVSELHAEDRATASAICRSHVRGSIDHAP